MITGGNGLTNRITDYAELIDRDVMVELWYPRSDDRPNRISVGLIDVRAADDLIIQYDFDRDGWVIFQDEVVQRDGRIDVVREQVEVAFIRAWNVCKHSEWEETLISRRCTHCGVYLPRADWPVHDVESGETDA